MLAGGAAVVAHFASRKPIIDTFERSYISDPHA
jgi:hypothetical protein